MHWPVHVLVDRAAFQSNRSLIREVSQPGVRAGAGDKCRRIGPAAISPPCPTPPVSAVRVP